MMHSCYSSLILFFIPWAAMHDTVRDDGKDIADYQSFALLAQTCLLVVMNIQVGGGQEATHISVSQTYGFNISFMYSSMDVVHRTGPLNIYWE